MRIRSATLLDITGIILYCTSRQDEVLGPEDPRVWSGHFRRQLKHAIRSDDSQVFIVLNKSNVICGVFVAWIAGYCWNPLQYATDILFLADQGGNFLLNKVEAWAKSKGVKKLILQTHLAFQGDRVKKLYTRKGFTEVGSVFEKEL